MSNQITKTQQTLKSPEVKKKFEEVLGKKTEGFVASLLSVVGNSNLKNADANSVMTAAMKAATLDLPIEPSLGFAYVIPYGREAQFQIGYKGFIQLALRSGQLTGLNCGIVYESQFVSYDPLFEELELDFTQQASGDAVGYFASMKLANGFKKVTYWSKEQVLAHKKKFVKSANGPWRDHFDAMAQKTVLKAMLTKYAPASIESKMIQTAITEDDSERFENAKDVTPDEPIISIDESVTSEVSQNEPSTESQEQLPEDEVEELFPIGKS
ncbi:Recombinational DNA repair protein RecT (prophage associated) [Lactococcus lactis subsp. lactis]|uniref:Recombinational DNA repair protein RecT (Prophage associated) n=1 Tax=Lactococcus lactis subsp. lactis TaxID=1360 RepID=A0A0V8CY52_LACLL|nr:recombinase RecT [Lactococcus lactis]KSU06069.1 Recombinational DNA repair protein RecT (prophage associated) [Lactococcus lactis subsp. lactis]